VRKKVLMKAGGFEVSWPAAEDIELSLRLSRMTRLLFDPDLAVYTSARRAREGYWPILWRTVVDGAGVVLAHRKPRPVPDIR